MFIQPKKDMKAVNWNLSQKKLAFNQSSSDNQHKSKLHRFRHGQLLSFGDVTRFNLTWEPRLSEALLDPTIAVVNVHQDVDPCLVF